MTLTAFPHRRRYESATVLITILTAVSPAAGAPGPTTPPNETDTASLNTLRANLATAAAGYIKAESELAASQTKQAEL